PISGIYALTSNWFVKRTRAYLRRAEFGFFGVIVPTRVQTPRFCGEFTLVIDFLKLLYIFPSAGDLEPSTLDLRGLRTNWLIVGIFFPPLELFSRPHIQVVHF